MGLMVWEEFMFACALYPSDKDFLATVKEEAIYQVKRLIHHASVVIWSGNNENEQAITERWFPESIRNPYVYGVLNCLFRFSLFSSRLIFLMPSDRLRQALPPNHSRDLGVH